MCTYDLVAACYNSKQLVGVQIPSGNRGPRSFVDESPQAVAAVGQTVFAATVDRRLWQFSLPELRPAPPIAQVGDSPNHMYVQKPWLYVVNSLSDTLQIFRFEGAPLPDGGESLRPPLSLDLIGGLHFGENTSPQAIAKIGDNLFIPLWSTGKVARVDVGTPWRPSVIDTYDLNAIDLRPFGEPGQPYPAAIGVFNGQIYVALSNLRSEPPFWLRPAGPGILAKINPGQASVSAVYLGERCLNTYWVATDGHLFYASCAGRFILDEQGQVRSVEKSGVVALDESDRILSTWSVSCGGLDTGCIPPALGRFVVADEQIYSGELSGRIFVAQWRDGSLVERRGYQTQAEGPPIEACPEGTLLNDLILVP